MSKLFVSLLVLAFTHEVYAQKAYYVLKDSKQRHVIQKVKVGMLSVRVKENKASWQEINANSLDTLVVDSTTYVSRVNSFDYIRRIYELSIAGPLCLLLQYENIPGPRNASLFVGFQGLAVGIPIRTNPKPKPTAIYWIQHKSDTLICLLPENYWDTIKEKLPALAKWIAEHNASDLVIDYRSVPIWLRRYNLETTKD